MKVRVYDSFDRLPALVPERNGYPNQPEFLLSNDWFSILFETSLKQSLSLRIYVVSDANSEEMLAIMYCGAGQDGRRLIGLTNFYSQVFAPILFVDRKRAEAVIGCLVDFIAAERPGWTVFELRYLREDRPEYALLQDSLASRGFLVNPFRQYNNWYYTLEDESFAQYFESRPSRLKNTLRRKENKLRRDHEVEIRIFRRDNETLGQGIADYTSIYNSSWKQPEPFREFTPALIVTCARLGILRLGVLYVDDRPVATQLWITNRSKAIIYKLCYDEAYKKQSVGTILSHELFRIAIDEDRVREIDYGVGDEAYKRDWMADTRQIGGLEAINTGTIPGFVMGGCVRIKNIIKTIVNR